MKKEPLVTIVTLTYNKFDSIYKTISSVFKQDYANIELIISDDGSSSFPEQEIQKYIESNNIYNLEVRVIRHPINIGTVKNINHAYREARGEYIINLSCGDVLFEKGTVSKIMKRFRETGADLILTSKIAYQNNYEPLFLVPYLDERSIIEKLDTNIKQYKQIVLQEYNGFASGSVVNIKKSLIEEMGYYDENYYVLEDYPFFIKYTMNKKIELAHDIISIWYEIGGISTEGRLKRGSKLYDDMVLLSTKEKLRHKELFNKKEIKRIKYRIARLMAQDSELIYTYIKYLPQLIYYLRYSSKRKKMKIRDKDYIEKILQGYDKEYLICK